MAGENSLQFLGLNFEDILPWGVVGGDTGLSARLKLKRNFDKIQTRFNADQALYLSKINDDTAQGLIRLIRGLQVGERFVTGLLGEGGIFRKEADGTTYIEADKLYIRMKAYFDSVEMREYRHSVGNRIASEAGAKCCRVDWIDASGNSLKQTSENLASTVLFRCYFRGSDGEDEVRNNFIVGDLAYCHITTVETEDDSPIAKGLNMTHYWRLIVGRNAHGTLTDDGEHWIDLSNRVSETVTISGTSYTRKGYQPGSDVPAAQNDIIQLGNIRDTDRQGAIIEFVTGADAPSYQIFQGIGSDVSNPYSLEGKNYVRFGYDSESGGAQAFIGNPDGSTYLWYHNVTEGGVTHPKLEIKAEVSLSSTFGGKSFEELVVEYAPEGWTEEEITQLIVDETDPMFSDIETALDTIQRQVDGSISTWFYGGAPTLSNQPASQWDTADLKNEHLGDLYYDNLTGYGYRFKYDETSRQWSWGRITDVDVTKALADAAKAQDTADHKRRVFVVQPTPPYDQGDLWVNATYPSGNTETNAAQNKYYNDVLRCKTAKASGTTFAIADWELASKYTDDTAFNNFFANTYQPFVTQIQSQVDGKAETWYQATDPSAAWNTSALKQAHVGDIWHNTSSATVSGVEAGQDAIWSGSEWKPSTVPQEVYDKIDGKADIFVSKPSTYNANDMWIIESGLASSDMPSGCVVGDIVISSAARKNSYTKSDWKKKDRYTDDSSLIAFIGGYTGTAQELQNQIDKKAETWYQATNPASVSGWVAEDHVGDLWYCTADISGTSYKAGTTWYYMDNGASASPRYAWVQQDIPDAVFDMIDGKAQIFVSQPSNYHAKDLWILAADTTVNGVACKQGEVLVSSADSATYNQAHWSRKLRYTDDSALNTFLNGYAGTLTGIITSIINAQNAADAAQHSADDANALAATANYLKQAFLDNTGQAQTTDITGGLVLSTIVALRDANKKVWSGISGAYQAQETGTGYKGHGIAAWYGGGMVDGEVSTSSSNAAKSLFRFDGSGYVASGNLSWDKNGNVTIQGYSINATTLQVGGSAVATEAALASYLPLSAGSDKMLTGTLYAQNVISKETSTYNLGTKAYYWKNLFVNRIYLAADVYLEYDSTNASVKLNGSLYATGGVSALGAGSGGSSGTGDVTWALLASSSDTRQIALSHLTTALSSYATQSWVNSQIAGMSTSLAGLSDVNVSGVTSGQYLKFNGQGWVPDTPSGSGGTVTAVKVGTTTYNPSSGVVSLPAYPTNADTLDGYHASGGNTPFGTIPIITVNGFMDVGNSFEMHYDNSGSLDYSTRLYCTGDYGNSVALPSGSGTLALTTDNVASATKLQTPRTIWGQSFDGTGNVSGAITGATTIEAAGYIYLTNNTRYHRIYVKNGENERGMISYDGGNATNLTTGYWRFYEYSPNSTASTESTGFAEIFSLPRPTKGLTESKSYNILTTKDLSFSITGNAATATKLQTARTLWGQDFDGTGNVTGSFWLGNSTDNRFYVRSSISGENHFHSGFLYDTGGNEAFVFVTGYTASRIVFYTHTPLDLYTYGDYQTKTPALCIYDGRVSINKLLPDTGYNLDVDGAVRASSFVVLNGTSSQFLKADGSTDSNSYLPLSGGTMANTNLVTNLNAQYLNGYGAFNGSNNGYVLVVEGHFCEMGKHIEFHYDKTSGLDYSTILACTGNHKNFVNLPSTNGTLALTTDNVASATKLQTARTIWGQSFDGSANVSGDMSSVGNISFSASGKSIGGFLYFNTSNSRIGIGVSSPSYAVHVSGSVYATGAVTCLSDIREKMIVRPTEIMVEQIAKMPSIVYRWKDNGDDHDEHVGSIAQDWQKTLPQVVLTAKDEKKTLSMQYGVAALVSAITIARKVVDHERRIKELENENRKLKEQLKIA